MQSHLLSGRGGSMKPRQDRSRYWRGFPFGRRVAADDIDCQREASEEIRLPISALLARIRTLIPRQKDGHYDEIVRSFGVGALRPPPTPMSDGELARAISAFLKERPSAESVSSFGRRLDPSSGT